MIGCLKSSFLLQFPNFGIILFKIYSLINNIGSKILKKFCSKFENFATKATFHTASKEPIDLLVGGEGREDSMKKKKLKVDAWNRRLRNLWRSDVVISRQARYNKTYAASEVS